MPRKIGELELDFENPTWRSNWDFEEFKAGWAGVDKQQKITNY